MSLLETLGSEVDRFLRAISPTNLVTPDKLGPSASSYKPVFVWFQRYLSEQSLSKESAFPNIKTIHDFYVAVKDDKKIDDRFNRALPDRELLKTFITFLLAKGKAAKTTRSYVGAIQSLFKYAEIPITTAYSNMPPGVTENPKYPWTIEQVGTFIKSMKSPMYRCLGVWYIQTGLSNYDLLHMTYGKIKEQYENDVSPFCLNLVRHKTRKYEVKFRAFIGALGIRYFREYYEALPKALEVDDLIFNVSSVAGDGKGKLVEYAWQLKKRGLQDNTIALRTYVLSQLVKKGADLLNPDSVETILATENLTAAKKKHFVSAYVSFAKVFKIAWEPIKVKYQPKEPFIPTHEELVSLIHAASKRTATFLQVALDTGARCGEIAKLKFTDINTENLTISINNPEKNSRARTLPVTQKTIAMIQALPNKYDPYIFNPNPQTTKTTFMNLRNKLAETQKNPRFKQMHLHTFRHWFACNLYRKTKILKTVQDALGHRSIVNTEIYTRLVVFRDEEYYSATAKNIEEVRKLAEDGWSFFCEFDGVKVFRKPK